MEKWPSEQQNLSDLLQGGVAFHRGIYAVAVQTM